MIRSRDLKVLDFSILFSILALSAGDHVSTSLHGSITLPCSFWFVASSGDVSVIWDKKVKSGKQIVYWIREGKENLREQDPRYRGRVEVSTEFTQGDLSLTLRNVTYEDAGTYSCRAANKYDTGDKEVTLSIDGNPTSLPTAEEHVSTYLYGSVILPCSFPFVQSVEGLTAIWDKEEKGRKQILYWILAGKEHLEEQDPRYRGRIELSTELPQGNLSLTLKNISYEDEGTYSCRAANKYDNGDKAIMLSIEGLDADDPNVTLVTIGGKRYMRCTGSGVYHHPQVQWITTQGEDLSDHGKLTVTNQSDGWKLVESLLEHDLEANVQVWCHIKEGRLKKSAEATMPEAENKSSTALIGTWITMSVIISVIICCAKCGTYKKRRDDRTATY